RSRHTRSKRDWSSDVCSSDLPLHLGERFGEVGPTQNRRIAPQGGAAGSGDLLARCCGALLREFLRGGRDVVAADRTALGGCGRRSEERRVGVGGGGRRVGARW